MFKSFKTWMMVIMIAALAAGNVMAMDLSALFVAGEAPPNDLDSLAFNFLISMGFEVTIVDDDISATADADDKDIVVISEFVSSGNVADKFKDVEIPVVTMEPYIFDDMMLCTAFDKQDAVEAITIVEPDHYLACDQEEAAVIHAPADIINWGTPAGDGLTIAHLPEAPEKAAIFVFDEGDLGVDGFEMPGRRVGFFFQGPGMGSATQLGWRMYEAAILWALELNQEGDALFVTGDPEINEDDALLIERLARMGYDITVVDDDLCATADADDKDLVLIGEFVSSGNVADKYKDVEVPVVSCEPYIFDDMLMCTAFDKTDGIVDVQIIEEGDPMAAGLAGTFQLYDPSSILNWGTPAGDGVSVAAVLDDPTHSIHFYFDEGDLGDQGFEMPARRVGTFMQGPAPRYTTDDGWKLIDAAILWAVDADEIYHLGAYPARAAGPNDDPGDTAVEDAIALNTFELTQNYPNPFNPSTTISFTLNKAGHVKLAVYNILGEEVAVLLNEVVASGQHRVEFNAGQLESGLYLYRIQSNDVKKVGKMTLAR